MSRIGFLVAIAPRNDKIQRSHPHNIQPKFSPYPINNIRKNILYQKDQESTFCHLSIGRYGRCDSLVLIGKEHNEA
jgi:hypothetical protein